MFGKDQTAISNAHGALKYLAWIEPNLIFPGFLSRVYPALETLTEVKGYIDLLFTHFPFFKLFF